MSQRALPVVVLVVIGGLMAGCGSESTDPSTVAPEEVVAATAADQSYEIAFVEETIAAANAGDYDEWISHFAPDALIPLNTLADVSVEDHFRFEVAIGTTRTMAEPCKMVANSVECELTIENDLFASAGLAPTLTSAFFFDRAGKIITVNEDFSSDLGAFFTGYITWMKEAHPDAHAQIMEAEAIPYMLMTPVNAPVFLAHVDEFVAQSAEYPKP